MIGVGQVKPASEYSADSAAVNSRFCATLGLACTFSPPLYMQMRIVHEGRVPTW
jgi:hypothetical protein